MRSPVSRAEPTISPTATCMMPWEHDERLANKPKHWHLQWRSRPRRSRSAATATSRLTSVNTYAAAYKRQSAEYPGFHVGLHLTMATRRLTDLVYLPQSRRLGEHAPGRLSLGLRQRQTPGARYVTRGTTRRQARPAPVIAAATGARASIPTITTATDRHELQQFCQRPRQHTSQKLRFQRQSHEPRLGGCAGRPAF